MRLIANLLSWVFHPLLLTTYLVLFLGYFYPPILGINTQILLWFGLFILAITFILPASMIGLGMVLSGRKADFTMKSRQERITPFILISLFYCFFAAMFFYKAILTISFNRLLLIVAALVLIGTLITLFYKISVHAIGAGGFAGILIALNRITEGQMLYPVAIVIVLAGLIMSARLFLNAHTLREVLSGGLVGFIVGLGGSLLLFH